MHHIFPFIAIVVLFFNKLVPLNPLHHSQLQDNTMASILRFFKPRSPTIHEDDHVFPLHLLDLPKPMTGFMITTLLFNDQLDPDVLHQSLSRLLSIGNWRKMSCRDEHQFVHLTILLHRNHANLSRNQDTMKRTLLPPSQPPDPLSSSPPTPPYRRPPSPVIPSSPGCQQLKPSQHHTQPPATTKPSFCLLYAPISHEPSPKS